MCSEGMELEKRLNSAALQLSSALQDESTAILQGGPDIGRIRQLVKDAEQEWENAEAAFRKHLQHHGC